MSRRRFVALLVAALAAICAALFASNQRNPERESHGTSLLPSLAQELNTVTELKVTKGGAAPVVTLRKQGEQWTVAQRADYPADVAKLRKLLLGLSDAKIREEKTSNPASYPIIGVEDPSLPGAASAQIEYLAQDGKHAVIIGKPVGEGNFVRRAGEKASYIVEPGISFEAEPRYWIDTRLIDLSPAAIQSIEFKPSAGPGYTLHKAPAAGTASAGASVPADAAKAGVVPAAGNFVLDNVPAKRQAAEARVLAPAPGGFGNLAADDVAQAAAIDFSKPSVLTVKMSDGSIITLTGTVAGDKRWIQLASSKDSALNAKTNGRAFEIASYRYDAIFRPLEQLLVPLPAPPKPAAAKP